MFFFLLFISCNFGERKQKFTFDAQCITLYNSILIRLGSYWSCGCPSLLLPHSRNSLFSLFRVSYFFNYLIMGKSKRKEEEEMKKKRLKETWDSLKCFFPLFINTTSLSLRRVVVCWNTETDIQQKTMIMVKQKKITILKICCFLIFSQPPNPPNFFSYILHSVALVQSHVLLGQQKNKEKTKLP